MRASCRRSRSFSSEHGGRSLLWSTAFLSEFHCDRLVVIGVGLIGGSVAAALRRAGRVRRIVGVGRGRANIERALELGVIDEAIDDIAVAVKGADIVLLAVPVRQNARVLAQLAASLAAQTLVTDAGSTKMNFVADARRLLSSHLSHVVPGHPVAGAELTGVDAANSELFVDRNVVLTPLPENDAGAIDRIESMWKACGARVSRMSCGHHDQVFAAVSHLPEASPPIPPISISDRSIARPAPCACRDQRAFPIGPCFSRRWRTAVRKFTIFWRRMMSIACWKH